MENQPTFFIVLIIIISTSLLGMMAYDIYSDIKHSISKRVAKRLYNSYLSYNCPHCNRKLKLKDVYNYKDVTEYYLHCDYCKTTYRVYKENINERKNKQQF